MALLVFSTYLENVLKLKFSEMDSLRSNRGKGRFFKVNDIYLKEFLNYVFRYLFRKYTCF